MEKLGLTRALQHLKVTCGLKISELATDASITILAYMGMYAASTAFLVVNEVSIYRLDAETEGSTGFRNPKARGCSARAQRRRY